MGWGVSRPRLVVFDVGQGDAVLVQGRQGSLLVDAGTAIPEGPDRGRDVDSAGVAGDLAKWRAQRDELLAPVQARLQVEVDRRNAAAAGEREPVDLKPIGRWDFEGDGDDAIGGLHGELRGKARIEDGALVLNGGCLMTAPLPKELVGKSLEVLVQLDRLDQGGGGAMTVQTLDGV